MTRKEFFARVGFGAATVLLPACIAVLVTSCSSDDSNTGGSGSSTPTPTPTPTPTASSNFTVDTSTGPLATNGGFIVMKGIIIARTTTGTFLAVSSSCTHEGVTLGYDNSGNVFVCPRHNSQFTSTGTVISGPAPSNLKQYQTTLSGTTLTVIV
ncbi:ubiquinol-cytochrome c reductase iron-sulfur subunit [Flavobacterium sp. LB1P71]|uniref:QcrA and Rieske domain-containing protein n=1 Tax=unclassified Flavobacterium TaxID=196869 RepID=UPI003AAFB287